MIVNVIDITSKFLNNIYLNYNGIISFAKDLAIIYALYKGLVFLKDKSFNDKKKDIENDLIMKKKIKEELKEYFNRYYSDIDSKARDVEIITIYVKNYPYKYWKVNDAYKQHLFHYRIIKNNNTVTGYMTKTGICIRENIWRFDQSFYYNKKNKKWFIDGRNKKYKNYIEYKEATDIIVEIPFKNIINYDFDYNGEFQQAVIYTKYKSTSKKLYSKDNAKIVKLDDFEMQYIIYNLDYKKKAHKIRNLFKNIWRYSIVLNLNKLKRKLLKE